MPRVQAADPEVKALSVARRGARLHLEQDAIIVNHTPLHNYLLSRDLLRKPVPPFSHRALARDGHSVVLAYCTCHLSDMQESPASILPISLTGSAMVLTPCCSTSSRVRRS